MKLLPPAVLFAVCSTAVAHAQVMVTEVQPNPEGSDAAEWIELHNTGTAPVDVGGWQLAEYAGSAVFDFPAGTILAAGQVVIVTLNAADFASLAAAVGFPVAAADYELALASDDPSVPNLTASGSGTFGLANGGGGVLLLDATAASVSWAEWGTDQIEVPGSPAGSVGSGESIGRVNVTGSSDVDFAVLAAPTPGPGFAGVTPTPPIIRDPTRGPANLSFGATFSVSATVADADGLAGVELYIASATASTGPADASYTVVAATNTAGDEWRASGVVDSLVPFPQPAGFAERYVRYFFYALDNQASDAELPSGAVTGAANTAYYWENVLPENTVFTLAEVRAQDASEVPIYDGHSVRVEGVVLTGREAFLEGSTNFFIAAPAGADAIRVFDDDLIADDVMPGDVVRVTGKIGAFRGVRQIGRDERSGQPAVLGPEIEVTVIGNAPVPVVTTDVATLLANGEQNESQLVEIAGVMLVPNPNNGDPVPATWTGNTTLYASDATGTLAVRVVSNVDLADTPTPAGTFGIRGIFTQFAPNGIGGYQLQPRGLMDVIGGGPAMDGGLGDAGEETDGGTTDGGGSMDAKADAGPDTGTHDAGSGVDATTPDAPRDAGFFGTERTREGCGCAATRTEGEDLSPAWLLPFGLLFLRRRR